MNFFAMLRQLFAMIGSFSAAGQSVGRACENLAMVAEETSAAYLDESRSNRRKAQMLLEAEEKATQKQLAEWLKGTLRGSLFNSTHNTQHKTLDRLSKSSCIPKYS